MHIIKVEHVLINVRLHLLAVLAKVGRFLVVSLRIRSEILKSPEKQLGRRAQRQCQECADLGSQEMELRVYFPALIVQEPAKCKSDLKQLPPLTVKKHGESGALLSFNTKVWKWAKESRSVLARE